MAIIERETAACYADAPPPARRRRTCSASWAAATTRSACGELNRLFAARPDLTDADREAIAHMACRLQNQFLHHPRAAVRSAVPSRTTTTPTRSSTPSATSSASATGPRTRSRRSERNIEISRNSAP